MITGIGVVSPFGVGRERFWDHISGGCSGTRAITEFDASEWAAASPRRAAGEIADVPPIEGDDIWTSAIAPIRKRIAGGAGRRHRGARSSARRGAAHAEPQAGVIVGSGGGGIDVGER